MFVTGDVVRNVPTGNLYRVDESGLTLLAMSHKMAAIMDLAAKSGLDVSGMGIGTTFPFSVVDPNDFLDKFEKVDLESNPLSSV